jgi:hypothetical protein
MPLPTLIPIEPIPVSLRRSKLFPYFPSALASAIIAFFILFSSSPMSPSSSSVSIIPPPADVAFLMISSYFNANSSYIFIYSP